jgi:ATP-binding cassette subfamily A (ABC1) protein 2
MPIFLNVMNNAILRANVRNKFKQNREYNLSDTELDLKASEYGIVVTNHPMNQTNNILNKEYFIQGSDVLIAIFTIVAMSFINASFVLFLVYERSIKSLHLQFLIGLNPLVYWLCNFVWDMLNYMLPAGCVIFILKVFDVPAYVHGENYSAVVLLFLFYGWSVGPLLYPLSFIFKEPSRAYIFLIVINLFTGITCLESSFLFQIFSFDQDLKLVYDTIKSIYLIFPPYCLGRGLVDIAYNNYFNLFYSKTGQIDKIRSVFEWEIVPQKLTAMACVGVTSFLLTILLEYEFFKFKWLQNLYFFSKNNNKNSIKQQNFSKKSEQDFDVQLERERIQNKLLASKLNNDYQENDQLVLNGLRKIFFKKKKMCGNLFFKKKFNKELIAVDDLTFGVPKGECFGLLGKFRLFSFFQIKFIAMIINF